MTKIIVLRKEILDKMIQSVKYKVGIKIKYQALNQIFKQFWHIPTQVENQINSQVHEFIRIKVLIKTNLYFYTTLKNK